jgi:flagellar hook assembly protein FlgD
MLEEGPVEIAIYDVAGRRVRTLVNRVMPEGDHEAVWDGRNDTGRRAAPGVYLYRFQGGGAVETQRVVMLP